MHIPCQQLVVDLVWRGDQNCLPHAVGTESFGLDDLFILELMIRDETKAQILLTYPHPPDVVLADEVNVGFHRVEP